MGGSAVVSRAPAAQNSFGWRSWRSPLSGYLTGTLSIVYNDTVGRRVVQCCPKQTVSSPAAPSSTGSNLLNSLQLVYRPPSAERS